MDTNVIYNDNEVLEMMKDTFELYDSNDLTIDEIMDVYNYYEWTKEQRFADFINYITNYVENHGILISDEFNFNYEKAGKYAPTELDGYLTSLFFTLYNTYNEDSYCIKYNNKLYSLELFEKDKACIIFSTVLDNPNSFYVDYNHMLKEL